MSVTPVFTKRLTPGCSTQPDAIQDVKAKSGDLNRAGRILNRNDLVMEQVEIGEDGNEAEVNVNLLD
jgi:hypothetical protein